MLNFYIDLDRSSLEEEALAKQIYKQAEENGWPGLGMEVKYICEQIQIPDINKYDIPKKEIQEAIFEAHYRSMISQFETSTHCPLWKVS